jgi:hypothetical protein
MIYLAVVLMRNWSDYIVGLAMRRCHFPNYSQRTIIAPLQHLEVDIGELVPARCLSHGLWLSGADRLSFALLLCPDMSYGRHSGMHVEIAVPPGEKGASLSRQLFDELEKLVRRATSYSREITLPLTTTPETPGRCVFTNFVL